METLRKELSISSVNSIRSGRSSNSSSARSSRSNGGGSSSAPSVGGTHRLNVYSKRLVREDRKGHWGQQATQECDLNLANQQTLLKILSLFRGSDIKMSPYLISL